MLSCAAREEGGASNCLCVSEVRQHAACVCVACVSWRTLYGAKVTGAWARDRICCARLTSDDGGRARKGVLSLQELK